MTLQFSRSRFLWERSRQSLAGGVNSNVRAGAETPLFFRVRSGCPPVRRGWEQLSGLRDRPGPHASGAHTRARHGCRTGRSAARATFRGATRAASCPWRGYLEGVRDICSRHGIVLIFDEIITGFRLGLSGAQGYFGVTPDLATFGKAMASGFTLSCLAGRRELRELIAQGRVNHSGTFNSNVARRWRPLTRRWRNWSGMRAGSTGTSST